MPGTRTAPDPSVANPNYVRVSLGFIDAEGDLRSISMVADAAVTNAQIQAYADAVADASNASLYSINKTEVWAGAESKGNALNEVNNSVYSNIVYHVKASPTSSQRGYIPAPIADVFVAGTDDPDPNDALIIAFFTATLALAGGAYTGQSLRYTERREQNDAIKL